MTKKNTSTRCMLALMLLGVWVSACAPAAQPTEPSLTRTPTATVTPAATASPTVIWFPPTSTPTRFPTQPVTATPDMRPAPGALLLTDNFADPQNWQLLTSTSGSSTLANNALAITLIEPRAYIAATRTDLYLTDFYLEVTADVRLCMGGDQFGIILRAASPADFYRIGFSCDGQMRLDRIRGGSAASPLPWVFSASVPQVAPATLRIGVLAQGGEFRVFINDVFQVSVRDPLIPGGTIGVFARSAGDNAVTVLFSELAIWDVGE